MNSEIQEFRLKLYPKDFTAARAFYENDVGFAVVGEWDRGDHDKGVMFTVGGAILELLSPEGQHKTIQGVDISLEVADITKLWHQWQGRPNVVFPLRDNSWGDSSFCIAGPEDFKITFFAKP